MNTLATAGLRWLRLWGLALACLGWCTAWAQAAVQPVPALRAHVMDDSGTLTAAEVAALEQELASFEQKHGTQIAVLLVPSTAPEDIADYTQRVAEAWKLGRARVGDGLLLVVAVQDRRVRIAPYKALEGAVPDVLAKRIIDQQIVPAFRRGDYAGGLRGALTQLQAHITGEALPEPSAPTPRPQVEGQVDEFDLIEAGMLLLVAVPLVSGVLRQILGQRLGSVLGAGAAGWLVWQISGRVWLALLAGLIGFFLGLFSRALPTPRYGPHPGGWGGHGGGWHSGGGGFGGGGGGGFSSGGGGDSGGGGASGGW